MVANTVAPWLMRCKEHMYRAHGCGCVRVCAGMMQLIQQGIHLRGYNVQGPSWSSALLALGNPDEAWARRLNH